MVVGLAFGNNVGICMRTKRSATSRAAKAVSTCAIVKTNGFALWWARYGHGPVSDTFLTWTGWSDHCPCRYLSPLQPDGFSHHPRYPHLHRYAQMDSHSTCTSSQGVEALYPFRSESIKVHISFTSCNLSKISGSICNFSHFYKHDDKILCFLCSSSHFHLRDMSPALKIADQIPLVSVVWSIKPIQVLYHYKTSHCALCQMSGILSTPSKRTI